MPTELESRDQWSRMQYGRWLRSLAGVATIGLGLLTSPVFAQQPEPDYFAGSADAQPLTAADAQSPPK
jgi:hypothetical protein